MSRISRYHDSISKFIRNKSNLIDTNSEIHKYKILNIITNFDYISSILLLTILNTQAKRNNITVHGYYMAAGINFMMIIVKLLDNADKYEAQYNHSTITILINELLLLINMCLAYNIESIEPHYNSDKLIKIYHKSMKLLNNKLQYIAKKEDIIIENYITNNDIITHNFNNIQDIRNKLIKIKKVEENSLHLFTIHKYGQLCQIALYLGWMLGGGQDRNINYLDKVGTYIGMMIKITSDFINMEANIYETLEYSNNYIVNYGIQYGFELFMTNKEKFIYGCIKLNIYTNTIKELIDILEDKIDEVIKNTNIDLNNNHIV